jgi:hypothetical protein
MLKKIGNWGEVRRLSMDEVSQLVKEIFPNAKMSIDWRNYACTTVWSFEEAYSLQVSFLDGDELLLPTCPET